MATDLSYWSDIYKTFKKESICLDIEVTDFGGPISVIGIYTPKPGLIECQTFIKGRNLNKENMQSFFSNAKLLITFNGLAFDIPKIKSELPGLIPDNIKILDLFLFAKALDMPHSLRTLENTFGIERLTKDSEKKRVAVKLWHQYMRGSTKALKKLIDYNVQDTINLYFLAEKLIALADSKTTNSSGKPSVNSQYKFVGRRP
ncbi:ribonuclease H-like domain-containing protein [Candidatus Pacearchaeota archaeon]|nr:ribonuclease H-like domain-containing protein [Candidatus Pacearchaeota archaeon]